MHTYTHTYYAYIKYIYFTITVTVTQGYGTIWPLLKQTWKDRSFETAWLGYPHSPHGSCEHTLPPLQWTYPATLTVNIPCHPYSEHTLPPLQWTYPATLTVNTSAAWTTVLNTYHKHSSQQCRILARCLWYRTLAMLCILHIKSEGQNTKFPTHSL
jgi:hypothetical protein